MKLFGLKIELDDQTPVLHRKYLKRKRIGKCPDEIVKGISTFDVSFAPVHCPREVRFAYEADLQIPYVLTRVEDWIFNGMPADLARVWPQKFLSAIRPEADFTRVWPQFAAWLIEDPLYGAARFESSKALRQNLLQVADMYLDGCSDPKKWWAAINVISKGTFSAEISNRSANGAASQVAIKAAVAAYQGLSIGGVSWALRSPLNDVEANFRGAGVFAAQCAACSPIWAAAANVLADDGQHNAAKVEANTYALQSEKLLELLSAT